MQVITQLAKIAALDVISRTSVMEYREGARNLRIIADELGATHILEGTVRRGADEFRVTSQLIDASTDAHLWANSYDRAVSVQNLLAIQSDIAREVTTAVGGSLTETERARIATVPTDDWEAYEDYLVGRSTVGSVDLRRSERGLTLLERAVGSDPGFVPALARLADAHVWQVWFFNQFDHLALAEQTLEALDSLAPDAVETQAAWGRYYYQGRRDYERALQHLLAASRVAPGDPAVNLWIAYIRRRQGSWDEGLAGLEQAHRLSPRSAAIAYQLGSTYRFLGRAEDAMRMYEKALSLNPDYAATYDRMFQLQTALGDTVGARAVLDRAPSTLGSAFLASHHAQLAQLRGDANGARAYWNQAAAEGEFYGELGLFHHVMGNVDRAVAYGDSLRVAAGQRLANELDNPQAGTLDRGAAASDLGLAYALMGDQAEARRYGQQGVDALPVSEDAISGTRRVLRLAQINTVLGDAEAAIDMFETLLSRPHPRSAGVEWLRLDPLYDPLRGHPRFEALLRTYTPSF